VNKLNTIIIASITIITAARISKSFAKIAPRPANAPPNAFNEKPAAAVPAATAPPAAPLTAPEAAEPTEPAV
jgi:hypothetical protein